MHHPLLEALLAVDRLAASRLVADYARVNGPLAAVDRLVAPSLEALGRAWDAGDASLAQVFVAARLCEEMVAPILPSEGVGLTPDQPRLAIAVLEDSHALGKRIVLSVLRAGGYVVQDYGAGVQPVPLADRAADDGVDVLLVSTLMLRSALEVRRTVDRLHARGFRGRVVVGGAPFRMDETLWRDVGADAMGRTAADALGAVAAARGGAR